MTDLPRRLPPARSSRPRWAHAGVAVAALVPALLAAACGSPTTVRTPAPTPGATPSVAVRASPAPSASARVDPGFAAVDRFVALVTKTGFSYQASFTGESRHTVEILPISKGLLEVSGHDVLVRASFRFPSGRVYAVEHRLVDGRAWLRYDTTDTWHRLTFPAADSMAAFAAVRTKADVTYLGPVNSGGKTWYRVSLASAIVNPVMIPATNLTERVLTSSKLTVLLDAAGRPVKGTAQINGRGRVSGQLQEIAIDLDLTFTRVGQAVSITAP